jgi:hypothetical protein
MTFSKEIQQLGNQQIKQAFSYLASTKMQQD